MLTLACFPRDGAPGAGRPRPATRLDSLTLDPFTMLRSLFAATVAVLATFVPAAAQTPGAAAVLNRFAERSDGNAFVRKDGAYLSAGRGTNCSAASLADGIYCFELTDPAGTVLLTTDPIVERSVRVKSGRMVEYLGTTRIFSPKGPCEGGLLRLVPYDTTPFGDGLYKLWLTRIEDYDPNGSHLFGFDPAKSKSDDFRVISSGAQTIVRGHVFFDPDRNGAWNTGEVALGGWRVELFENGVLDGLTFSDVDGRFQFIRDRDGATYDVRSIAPGGFVNDAVPGATWLATNARTGLVATSAEIVPAPEFGNAAFELQPLAGQPTSFWISTCSHEDDDDQGDDDDDDHDHHHDCGCPPTGRSTLEECDPNWRAALTTFHGGPVSLRRSVSSDNPNVSIYCPNPNSSFTSAFKKWKRYVTMPERDHAGFLLSREVAAALLNTSCGAMDGTIYVDRFQDGVLVSLDEMFTGAIGLLNETGAGLTGPNDPFQDLRHRMQMCTNEFRTINNTADPNAPQIVYRQAGQPTFYFSPY